MHGLPGAYALQLIELVQRWGIQPERLMEGLGVGDLHRPSTRLELGELNRVIRRAIELTGEPALAFHMGMQMQLSWHGFLGFAAMAAGDVREALTLAERYIITRTGLIGFSLHEEGEEARLQLNEHVALGDVREFITLALFVGLVRIGRDLVGRPLAGHSQVVFLEPEYFAKLAHLLPGEVRFGQPQSQLVFPGDILNWPLVTADPVAARLAREQCERELAELSSEADAWLGQVRELMLSEAGGVLKLEQLASRLGMSSRSLKRYLSERGTSYRGLADELRFAQAKQLLKRWPGPSVQEIAERLGYSDIANFSRAFRRWSGSTPQAYRQRERALI